MSLARANRLLDGAEQKINTCLELGRIGATQAETRRQQVSSLRAMAAASARDGFLDPEAARQVERGAAFAGLCAEGFASRSERRGPRRDPRRSLRDLYLEAARKMAEEQRRAAPKPVLVPVSPEATHRNGKFRLSGGGRSY